MTNPHQQDSDIQPIPTDLDGTFRVKLDSKQRGSVWAILSPSAKREIMKWHNQELARYKQEVIAALPDKRQRIDDAVDGDEEYGTFCANCGLSTDTDINTGKCYCDHYNEAIDACKAAIERVQL